MFITFCPSYDSNRYSDHTLSESIRLQILGAGDESLAASSRLRTRRRCTGSQKVEFAVRYFSASDEEVERSSTGSLSRGAVPKEARGH